MLSPKVEEALNSQDYEKARRMIDRAVERDPKSLKVWELWDRAVGEIIAENARPAAFKGKILLVHVNSSPWLHQLSFLKKDILTRINRELGQDLVDEIKFKIGPLR